MATGDTKSVKGGFRLPMDSGAKPGVQLVSRHQRRTTAGRNQTPNDEPQPQVVVAFGLRMTNCAPCKPSV
jgi:hypothetical protein